MTTQNSILLTLSLVLFFCVSLSASSLTPRYSDTWLQTIHGDSMAAIMPQGSTASDSMPGANQIGSYSKWLYQIVADWEVPDSLGHIIQYEKKADGSLQWKSNWRLPDVTMGYYRARFYIQPLSDGSAVAFIATLWTGGSGVNMGNIYEYHIKDRKSVV